MAGEGVNAQVVVALAFVLKAPEVFKNQVGFLCQGRAGQGRDQYIGCHGLGRRLW
jgi:hypothetical protein